MSIEEDSSVETLFENLPDFKSAACATTDPEIFFPAREGKYELLVAKTICQECVEFSKCRDFALTYNMSYGIWGGMGRNERKKLLKVLT